MNHKGTLRLSSLLLILTFLATLAAAKEMTLTFDDEWEVYTLTFDDARISETTVRNLAWLSPNMTEVPAPFTSVGSRRGNAVDKFFVPPQLTTCAPSDSTYQNCASNQPGSPAFFQNANVNDAKGKEQEIRLAQMVVPKELQRVRDYLLTTLKEYELLERAELTYLKTWNINNLEAETRKLCGNDPELAFLKDIGRLQSHNEKYHAIEYDWRNSANQCILTKKGQYPIADWNRFLANYGIVERFHVRRIE